MDAYVVAGLIGLLSLLESVSGLYFAGPRRRDDWIIDLLSTTQFAILVKPAERVSYLVSADTPGRWAYHCHLLYHMHAGMFRTVVVS